VFQPPSGGYSYRGTYLNTLVNPSAAPPYLRSLTFYNAPSSTFAPHAAGAQPLQVDSHAQQNRTRRSRSDRSISQHSPAHTAPGPSRIAYHIPNESEKKSDMATGGEIQVSKRRIKKAASSLIISGVTTISQKAILENAKRFVVLRCSTEGPIFFNRLIGCTIAQEAIAQSRARHKRTGQTVSRVPYEEKILEKVFFFFFFAKTTHLPY
jgi:hypothetical protein